jgi:hypothetical protein
MIFYVAVGKLNIKMQKKKSSANPPMVRKLNPIQNLFSELAVTVAEEVLNHLENPSKYT